MFLAELSVGAVCPVLSATVQVSEGKLPYDRLRQSLTASHVSALITQQKLPEAHGALILLYRFSHKCERLPFLLIWTLCSVFLAVKLDILIIRGGLFLTRGSQTFTPGETQRKKQKSSQRKQFLYNLLLAETYSANINSVTSDSLARSFLITPASRGNVRRAAYV